MNPNTLPLVELKHFAVASADHAKAVIKITHKNNSRGDKRLLTGAIRHKFNAQVEPVNGSFIVTASDVFSDTLSGIVRVIRQSIPYVEGQTRGFTSFASNMFMDNEKSIWALKETDSGKLLVQTSNVEDEDALNQLLSSFSSARQYTQEYKGFMATASSTVTAIGGDLVQYVNRASEPTIGYVVATVQEDGKSDRLMVLEANSDAPEVIAPELVLNRLDNREAPQLKKDDSLLHSILSATKSNASLEDMLSYYKLMFKVSPSYYEQFATRLKAHAFL